MIFEEATIYRHLFPWQVAISTRNIKSRIIKEYGLVSEQKLNVGYGFTSSDGSNWHQQQKNKKIKMRNQFRKRFKKRRAKKNRRGKWIKRKGKKAKHRRRKSRKNKQRKSRKNAKKSKPCRIHTLNLGHKRRYVLGM